MHILCIAGLIGSGKDTATDYIAKKYGYLIIHYSNVLREICRSEGMELTRDNLQALRVKYGNLFLAEEVVKRAKEAKGNVVLTSLRRSEDFEIPKKIFGDKLKLIVIESDAEERFKRLKRRGRENDPSSIEEFERQEAKENEIYDFSKLFSYADFTVENNGTMKQFEENIDKVMRELK